MGVGVFKRLDKLFNKVLLLVFAMQSLKKFLKEEKIGFFSRVGKPSVYFVEDVKDFLEHRDAIVHSGWFGGKLFSNQYPSLPSLARGALVEFENVSLFRGSPPSKLKSKLILADSTGSFPIACTDPIKMYSYLGPYQRFTWSQECVDLVRIVYYPARDACALFNIGAELPLRECDVFGYEIPQWQRAVDEMKKRKSC